jgi:hypothetical protein
MSARDRSSETGQRYVPFPADNLELASAPEEDDVDHRGDTPSWLPGTGGVGTGADPPDLDASGDEQDESGPVYAGGPDDSDAPGFSDLPMRGGGQAARQNGDATAEAPPDFGDAYAPGFGGGRGEPSAFGDAPGYTGGQAESSAFGDAPAFGGPPGGPGGGYASYGPAQGGEAFGSPGPTPPFTGAADDPSQGYAEAQPHGFGERQGAYAGPVTGEFRGDYERGYSGSPGGPDPGYGGAQGAFGGATNPGWGAGQARAPGEAGGRPTGDYGAAQDAGMPGAGGPPVGAMYGDQGYQENGSQPLDQHAGYSYSSQYRPVEPPKARVTASLRSVKRRSLGSGKRQDQQGRQALLTVSRIEPWSVMKFSFVISLVAFIVFFVAVAVLYAALSGLGVFSALQHSVENITSSQGSSGFNLMTYLSASRVLGYTGLLGAINVVLITALCTVSSVLYNLSANLAGGVEITLKESD